LQRRASKKNCTIAHLVMTSYVIVDIHTIATLIATKICGILVASIVIVGVGTMPKKRADGRYEQKKVIGGRQMCFSARTVKALNEKVLEAQRKYDQRISLVSSKEPLEQYLESWLKHIESAGNRSPSTVDKYRTDFVNHVYPLIGNILFTNCGAGVFDDLFKSLRNRVSDKTGKPLSQNTLRNIRAALRAAFNYHGAKKYHPVNPLGLIEMVKSKKQGDHFKPVALSPAVASQLIAELSTSRYGLAFRYMATMGFREGETLAIRKEDIDLDAGTVKITGSVRQRKGVGIQRGSTKTSAAKATLPLPASLIALTRAHIAAQGKIEAASPWLFPTRSGKLVAATNMLKFFKSRCVALNIAVVDGKSKLRIQDLRRYVGTQVAQRVDPRTAQGILRHANISTTMRFYVDEELSEQRRALSELDSMLDMDRIVEIPRKRKEA
jgi:integrase